MIWTACYTFVPDRDGDLHVPYLVEDDGKVVLDWNWLNNDWDANNPALRFANLFVSLPESAPSGFFMDNMPEINFTKIKIVHFIGIGGTPKDSPAACGAGRHSL